jgi:molybdopterin-guanine dinucleotide biosynthesis protein B
MKTTPVFGITGWKNSGKTQLVTRLVAEFTQRGLKVSTVKHAHHNFDVDKPGADSYRHREAGAVEVALVSGRRWALMHELRDQEEPPLEDILARLTPCDLILIEGYKRENHPKIETRRLESRDRGRTMRCQMNSYRSSISTMFRPWRISSRSGLVLKGTPHDGQTAS